MSTEEIYKIEEVLRILSSESRDTAGLGAPISILKSLLKDSETIEAQPSILPSAEDDELEETPEPVGKFIIDNSEGIWMNDGKYYHYSEVCRLLRCYAQLCVTQEMEKQKVKPIPTLTCKNCGDYFGININHYCYKCLKPMF